MSPLQPSLPTSLLLTCAATAISLPILIQTLLTHLSAYNTAPQDLNTYLSVLESSILENASYDHDISRISKLEDKLRLAGMVREIQKSGDELRELLDKMVRTEDHKRLRFGSRVLWGTRRRDLEERVRKLDLLRMRFLVVYLGMVAAKTEVVLKEKEREKEDADKVSSMGIGSLGSPIRSRTLPSNLSENIKRTPPLRRITSNAIGHNEGTGSPQRSGWMGVVNELQSSPLMHKRRASVEQSSSIGSPRNEKFAHFP
ncbi:hypothetical protein SS1G_10249 [Sclerotinia sclerotiorum 1980 UF-70]|uniref:Uncharacterized protein n=2 Tax=Sclerotinia sclerotiorum (strain ATCC 18683 / 1980 / Ss-1) TaxID=665079 RepID=A7EY34_SCLS1|nr:hypothetical protein SS1G_10249 [Sclerotinia sclerotiorum 1980 UF-70]APA16104.1 hypothetical protein sscle_16g108740 [Sclerotinia sclerotiorum 1980 UF-70]EDN94376.1 hypothetical protein SS1G_10249 [Sclerotinia sclerotiorum 1980 UF-70]